MRTAALGVALALCGATACGLPEDLFVLQGSLVDARGLPLEDTEVRLQRDASLDGFHCMPLLELARTRTGAEGQYRFELLRQQISMGSSRHRTFRVEATHEPSRVVSSYTFQFPSVDLALPPLLVGAYPVGQPGWETLRVDGEVFVDGVLAWRGGGPVAVAAEGRDAQARAVSHQSGTWRIDTDSFGSVEDVALQLRFEQPLTLRPDTGQAPPSRGAACSVGPEGGPCPLTDGRFLPFRLPPDTRALVLTFSDDQQIEALWLHGLWVEGALATVELEWSPTPTDAFQPYMSLPVNAKSWSGPPTCDEPGASFGPKAITVGRFPRPRRLRMKFVDAERKALPIQWLAEVSVAAEYPR